MDNNMDDTVIDKDAWLRFILHNHKYYDSYGRIQSMFIKHNIDPKTIDLSKETWFEQPHEIVWWNNVPFIQNLHILGVDINKTIYLHNKKNIKLLHSVK